MLALRPTVLYVPLAEILANPDLPGRLGVETQLAAVLPRVTWSGEDRQLAAQLREVYALGVRQLLVGNLGQLKIAKAAGFAVRGDFGLNIYNSRSMQYLRAQGVDSQLLSFELTLPQIRDISKAVPSEVLVIMAAAADADGKLRDQKPHRHVRLRRGRDEARRPDGRGIPRS